MNDTTAAQAQKNIDTWARRFKASTDRSLKRMAAPSLTPEGVPRVKIPDSVFIRGAEIHKDFVIGIFMGKTPSFGHIQSVLSHVWGKGKKLEIHLRHAERSMMVRIPNEVIRKKIVEHEIWYVGNTPLYVAQWTPNLAMKPPTLESIPIEAHVRGIPFDLYHQVGLSWVAGLMGDPIETDDFTLSMKDFSVAHLKIRANCSKPLPETVELEREDGSVQPVLVHYPWLPSICPLCKEMGHLQARCPTSVWVPVKKNASMRTSVTPATSDTNQEKTSAPAKTNHNPVNEVALVQPQEVSFLLSAEQTSHLSKENITHLVALPAQTPSINRDQPLPAILEEAKNYKKAVLGKQKTLIKNLLVHPPSVSITPSYFACLDVSDSENHLTSPIVSTMTPLPLENKPHLNTNSPVQMDLDISPLKNHSLISYYPIANSLPPISSSPNSFVSYSLSSSPSLGSPILIGEPQT